MSPYLCDGDYILIYRRYYQLRLGDIVVAHHQKFQQIIKRVVDISDQQGLLLAGDNAASVSSEQMGWFQPQAIKGKMLLRLSKNPQ